MSGSFTYVCAGYFLGRIGGATTSASAKVKNAIGMIGIFQFEFGSPSCFSIIILSVAKIHKTAIYPLGNLVIIIITNIFCHLVETILTITGATLIPNIGVYVTKIFPFTHSIIPKDLGVAIQFSVLEHMQF